MLSDEYATPPRPLGQLVRASAMTTIALATMVLAWRLRPASPSAAASPTAAVVLGCGWLAWALVSYLALGVAATAVAHLLGAVGASAEMVSRLAPASVSRLVEMAITLSIATAVLGTGGAASASVASRPHATSTLAPTNAQHGALDWPGLTDPVRPILASPPAAGGPAATAEPQPAQPTPSHRHHHAQVGLVSGSGTRRPPDPATTSREIVVRAGDSLWSIAARHLGPAASAQATAIAWHQWYAANRTVVGDDPDLIYPGQRLRAPAFAAATHSASSR